MVVRKYEWTLIGLSVVTIVLIVADIGGPVRAALALAAWLLVPGWAIVRLVVVDDITVRFCLTVAASFALAGFIGLSMVWTHFWHPQSVGVAVLLVSTVSLLIQLKPVPVVHTLRSPPEFENPPTS